MGEPITTGGVIALLVVVAGKMALSLGKRIKRSNCVAGGASMTMDFGDDKAPPEQDKTKKRQSGHDNRDDSHDERPRRHKKHRPSTPSTSITSLSSSVEEVKSKKSKKRR